MGYYVINNLIKERINNMFKELADVSLKSLDMINKNADNLNKLAEFLKDMQDNQNAMATKILELEKRLERYERPKN
jgi:RNase adaptor protein for sRNA GlmZ degradation